MALSIHTNYSSLITQTNLGKTNNALGTNQQRLGTGLRINSAADDAAGLQIATRLNAQSRGMDVAMRNTGDSISLLQTAEGAFSEMTDIMQRMKDLATQAANDTNSDDDRTSLKAEYDELGNELTNIISNTKYAGEALFAAGGKLTAAMTFQIGSSSAETLSFNASANLTAVTGAITTIKAETLDDATNAGSAMDELETALDAVGTLRSQLGANINRL
ncbi:Lateral flagellin, partial [Pseudomonas sp. UBA7530]